MEKYRIASDRKIDDKHYTVLQIKASKHNSMPQSTIQVGDFRYGLSPHGRLPQIAAYTLDVNLEIWTCFLAFSQPFSTRVNHNLGFNKFDHKTFFCSQLTFVFSNFRYGFQVRVTFNYKLWKKWQEKTQVVQLAKQTWRLPVGKIWGTLLSGQLFFWIIDTSFSQHFCWFWI